MRRSLKLALDDFGRATLEVEAQRYSVSPGELVGHAVKYYLADRDSGRAALRVPGSGAPPDQATVSWTWISTSSAWEEADAESQRQRVPLERLFEHAAMYLWPTSTPARWRREWRPACRWPRIVRRFRAAEALR